MNVSIKKLNAEMGIKNKGVEFEIRNTKNEFLGDLIVAKRGLTWCPGKTSPKNGVKKSWEEIISFFMGEQS